MTTTRIGYVGLGTMGGQMARRLVTQGYRVTGYDIDATRAGRAKDGGVVLATSPAGAAEGADIVFSSLPDPAAGRRVYLGPDGVLTGVKRAAAPIAVSPVDPAT